MAQRIWLKVQGLEPEESNSDSSDAEEEEVEWQPNMGAKDLAQLVSKLPNLNDKLTRYDEMSEDYYKKLRA